MKRLEGRISIPQLTVKAHGGDERRLTLFDPTFTKRNEVYPTPDGDAYLSTAGLTASAIDGITLSVQTPEGFIDHQREVGILPDSTRVIQRPITITHPDKIGYPASDPLALLHREGFRFNDDGQSPLLVSIFESPEVRREAQEVGLSLLGRPDSTLTNNKARLRQFAEKYGIKMFPGIVVNTWDELHGFANQHAGEQSWMKVSIGSGGDLVKRVHSTSSESVVEATRQMRKTVVQAFERGEFSQSVEEFWPEGDVSPVGFPNVIEEDAGVEGDIVVNGSNCFVTNIDGSVDYIGTFQQVTTEDGEYMGSRLYDPGDEVAAQIHEQTLNIARFNSEENGYYGMAGADFMVIKDADGKLHVRIIEVNSRPPISAYPAIMAHNLGAEIDGYQSEQATWENINLSSQRPIDNSIKIPDLIGQDLAFGVRDEEGNVLHQVIPIAVRSLVYQNGHGESELRASEMAKWFIWGSNTYERAIAREKLTAQGLVYKA